jgi:hypothetical protein
MSFDLTRAGQDPAFWELLIQKYQVELLAARWQGAFEPGQLDIDDNWDALHNVLNMAISEDGTEEEFAESDGGGIPGSADYASITELLGKFFVTGSYLNGGPYDSYEEAAAAAGLD